MTDSLIFRPAMLRAAALAAALALPAIGLAQDAPPAEPDQAATQTLPDGITHATLDNGLEVVVIPDHRAPVVVQMLWYRTGSADEQAGKSGLAHYFEHLMFKGTDTLEPGELSRIVTANGGSDNAFTSYDFTAYFQRIAADRLPLVMEMEADRMRNLKIGPEDWQTERNVILEERAQRTDSNPRALFYEQLGAAAYLNHPYGRPVIGWKQEVEALDREDALDFYAHHYAPNNAVLVLAGDVTPERGLALAQEYYGAVPPEPGLTRPARPQEPAQLAPRRMVMHDARVPQPMMTRMILAPERNPGDQRKAAALTVLAELLGGGQQSSVLGKALTLGGKAVYVGASYDGTAVDPSGFTLTLVPAPDTTPAEAEAALDATLDDFLRDGPDPAHLERVRAQIRAAQIYARDSAHGRAYDYGMGLAVGLGIDDVAAWPDLLTEVSVADLESAAAELLASPANVTGWLLPEGMTLDGAAPQTDEVSP